MNEFELIQKFFNRPNASPNIVESIGDDCAVMTIAEDEQMVVSIDTSVLGVHFPASATAYQIAHRAVRTAISDLAAMGARPVAITLALTIPNKDESWLEGFSLGLFEVVEEYNCPLIGGDTTRGPLTVTVQAHGAVNRGRYLSRAGAKEGDVIYLTGPIGDGAAALNLLLHDEVNFSKSHQQYLENHFYCPVPQVAVGLKLVDVATSAIDISDGLVADLNHICLASGVAAEIDIARLPISNATRCYGLIVSERQRFKEYENQQKTRDIEQSDGFSAKIESVLYDWALYGGDDYRLCFTAPAGLSEAIAVKCADSKAIAIGKIIPSEVNSYPSNSSQDEHSNDAESKVVALINGSRSVLPLKGYIHFE